jgi:CDP-diacylglycerol--serine O-phosphatidyltransferase
MRLARFNVQRTVVDARFFVGLPIPAGAAQLAAIVYVVGEPPTEPPLIMALLALVVAVAFLMVSTFRYRSFKGFDLRRRRSYLTVLAIALFFLLVATHTEATLLAMTSLYTASGPAAWAFGLLRRRKDPAAPLPTEAPQPQP